MTVMTKADIFLSLVRAGKSKSEARRISGISWTVASRIAREGGIPPGPTQAGVQARADASRKMWRRYRRQMKAIREERA